MIFYCKCQYLMLMGLPNTSKILVREKWYMYIQKSREDYTVLTRKSPPCLKYDSGFKTREGFIIEYHRNSKYFRSTFPVQAGGGGGLIFEGAYFQVSTVLW